MPRRVIPSRLTVLYHAVVNVFEINGTARIGKRDEAEREDFSSRCFQEKHVS